MKNTLAFLLIIAAAILVAAASSAMHAPCEGGGPAPYAGPALSPALDAAPVSSAEAGPSEPAPDLAESAP